MKKLLTILVLLLFAFTVSNTYAQVLSPGKSMPAGYQAPVLTQKSPAAVCLPCATPEGEADIPNDGYDVTDGGCNMLDQPPPNNVPLFKDVTMGQTYCGHCNGYTFGAYEYRDTDWYRFVLTAPGTIYWTCVADFYGLIFILDDDCVNPTLITYDYNDPGVMIQVSATLPAGTYHLWVGPQNLGPYWYNTGEYMVKLSDTPPGDPSTWCTAAIPTLSQWGLIILGCVLLGFGTFYIVRMRG